MFGYKSKICLIFILASFSNQVFSQQINRDSLSQNILLKPRLHYSVGSTFISIPHFGSVTGFTISPSLSIPLSPKLSVEGGIIAGRYYSALWSNTDGAIKGGFSDISVFGSASYHINSQLILYGVGIKQLTGNSPYNTLQKSSYTIGSAYNFGNFSIGVSVEMSKWNNNLRPMPFSQGFYSPYEQRPGILTPFGR